MGNGKLKFTQIKNSNKKTNGVGSDFTDLQGSNDEAINGSIKSGQQSDKLIQPRRIAQTSRGM
jgi:hypothetical protein